MKDLTIYFSTMSKVKNFNYLTAMVNRVDNSIITDTEAVELSIAEFLTSVRTGMVSQREHLSSDTVLKGWLEFSELTFGGKNDLDTVFHPPLSSFLIWARKVWNERDLSWLRASAMARSIKSSLNSRSCTILANMASCWADDSERNAVIKILATASLGLIRITSFQKRIPCDILPVLTGGVFYKKAIRLGPRLPSALKRCPPPVLTSI